MSAASAMRRSAGIQPIRRRSALSSIGRRMGTTGGDARSSFAMASGNLDRIDAADAARRNLGKAIA
jgi:hypothetical protein